MGALLSDLVAELAVIAKDGLPVNGLRGASGRDNAATRGA
jgi:hypothetical protein